MKKIFLFLAIVMLFFSCKKIETDTSSEEEIKLKDIDVKIELPSASTTNPNDLKVSSILTEEALVNNSYSKVSTFDGNSTELTFATNNNDNIVLLGYFNPKNTTSVTLNTESTALALLMLHPWTMDLSVEGKEDAIAQIKNMNEFAGFKNLVENSIKSGNLNPLSTTEIVNKIATIQKTIFARLTVYKKPLYFDIDKTKITIKNEYSSAAYSVGLYDANKKLIQNQILDGLGKFQATLNLVPENKFITTPIPVTIFTTPTASGNYTLISKSGLSFDNSIENKTAQDENIKIFVSNVFGLFSLKLKAILRLKTGACGAEISTFVLNKRIMSNSLIDYSIKKKSGFDFIKDFFSFSITNYSDIIGIVNRCSAHYNVKAKSFLSIAKILDVFASLESAYNGSAHLVDWIQYDKEIETCFQRSNNDIQSCGPASIEIKSGNNQTARNLTRLPKPLVVVVKDANGLPLSGVPVNWLLGPGSGSHFYNTGTNVEVNSSLGSSSITKADGTAGVDVLLDSGNPINNDNVTARIYRSDGSRIGEVIFSITVIR